jgi:hypothetical protein
MPSANGHGPQRAILYARVREKSKQRKATHSLTSSTHSGSGRRARATGFWKRSRMTAGAGRIWSVPVLTG